MLKVGDKAPEFTLLDQDGKEVSLSDYRGKKVVLYFYPKDNTPGCTNQACGFRDINQEIRDEGAEVLGVSRDGQKAHTNFIDKHQLNFTLLSDPEKTVHTAYGVWQEKKVFGKVGMGTVRTTFIIDENGEIEKVFDKVKAKDNPEEVLEYLKK